VCDAPRPVACAPRRTNRIGAGRRGGNGRAHGADPLAPPALRKADDEQTRVVGRLHDTLIAGGDEHRLRHDPDDLLHEQ
jgi:hypothetical protein